MTPHAVQTSGRATHVVRIEGARLGYRHTSVLHDVTFTVEPGQFWFFLGPNGTGKSTMVRAILGTVPLQEGTVEMNPAFSSRERIGFVPQRCDISASLPTTVREFVSLGLVGVPRLGTDEEERIAWALDKVGLAAMERRDFHTLSGGQRQRVLVARALARRPRFLIADEPTNGLDPTARDRLLGVLQSLHRHERLTVVFVTHDLDIAERFATHVALFSRGTVQAGPRDEILVDDLLGGAFAEPADEAEMGEKPVPAAGG
jgi:manganese/iron transport system ATP-binding protein